MASAPPPPQPPQPPQPQASSDAGPSSLSWEGDKMFNIYIYDYCYKRGFKKTAKELLAEADIAPDSTPPINARQGLLFEWWSVFWVLFQAKSNPLGGATEDALTYTQHQTRQAAMRMQSTQSTAPGANGPPLHIGSQAGMPPRMINGMPQRPGNFLTNGTLPNGVVPPGAPGPAPFNQPNGTTNPGNPPHGTVNPPPQAAFMPGAVRPPLNGPPPPPGQVQQVRGATTGPFQSPMMANSPPGPGAPPPQQPTQFGMPVGASPHMANMAMGRPNIPQSPMNPNPQGNTPQPGQQTGQVPNQFGVGRPPSRTTTPGAITQPSPSLAVRQVNGDIINMEILQIPNATLEILKAELGLSGKDISALTSIDKHRILQSWKARRPSVPKPGENPAAGPSILPMRNLQAPHNVQNRNKRNSNSPGDEHENLPRTESSPPERKRQRTSPGQTPSMAPMTYPGQQQPGTSGMQHPGMQPGTGGMPGPTGMQGPNPGMPMQPGGMQPGGPLGMPGGMQGHGPSGLQAPGGPGMMSQGPMPQGGPGPGGMPPGAPGMQQGGPGGGPGPGMQPPMGSGPAGMMLMQGPRMANGVPHPGGQMGMPPQMGGMTQMSPPQMGHPGGSQNMMTNAQHQMYRQNMHNMHKNNMPVNAASPASTDPSFNQGAGPQFNPSPAARPGANPAAGGQPQNRMPPPPSPAPGKDTAKDGKATDGSPRNQQTPNPAPATPAPNQQNAPSNHGTPVGGTRAAPSPVPGSVMGSLNPMNPPGGMNPSGGMNMNVGGMMGMNPPANLNQPPPTAGITAGGSSGGNNAGGGGAPGASGGGAPGAGGAPGGGVGSGTGGASGMNFLGMNPMVGMNAAAGTGLGMNMNMNMNPSAGGAGIGGMGDLTGNIFSQEFMQGVANALDDIDPNLFRPDGDINFERDFGQWFNHPEDPLDLK